MKKLLLLLSLSTFVLFSACKKNSLDKNKDDYDKEDWDKDEYDKDICFELVYPLTYEMPDNSEILVESEEDLWTDIKAWYEAHPDVAEKPSLQYPVEIMYGDEDDEESETLVINNEDEMIEAKKDCYEDKECFHLVYPITYEMPDGSTVSGDEENVWAAIKAWYLDHPDSEEKPSLQYPVEIIYGDDDEESETLVINSEDEMIEAKKDCYDKKDACFKLLFPYSFIMPDASVITADNEDNLWAAVKAWYETYPDVAEKPTLQYPVDVIINEDWDDDVEGETMTINNEEEMMALKTDCYEADEACFDLVFPISFTMPDASIISGDDEEILWNAIKAWYEAHPDLSEEDKPLLNYPVDIEYEDETIASIADEEAMILAKEDCYIDNDE